MNEIVFSNFLTGTIISAQVKVSVGGDFGTNIEPIVGHGGKVEHSLEEEKVSKVTSYVRNVPPIFEYYNGDWPEDTTNNPLPTPACLQEIKLMRVYLVINVDPNRPPKEFELESWVQVRNLKTNP